MAIEAVVFDWDGLVVDTENAWFQACQRVCAPHGVIITEEHRQDLMRSQLSAYLIDTFGLPVELEEFRPSLYAARDEILGGTVPLLPGATDSIDCLGSAMPLGVGTGARTFQVEGELAQLNLRDKFKAVVAADQVKRPKPEPDIYLEAANRLSVEPSDCVVLEDQPKGIKAAKAAGMICIAVPNKYLKGADYSEADVVVPHLGLVTVEFVQRLVS